MSFSNSILYGARHPRTMGRSPQVGLGKFPPPSITEASWQFLRGASTKDGGCRSKSMSVSTLPVERPTAGKFYQRTLMEQERCTVRTDQARRWRSLPSKSTDQLSRRLNWNSCSSPCGRRNRLSYPVSRWRSSSPPRVGLWQQYQASFPTYWKTIQPVPPSSSRGRDYEAATGQTRNEGWLDYLFRAFFFEQAAYASLGVTD
jgi:hypothetical protein